MSASDDRKSWPFVVAALLLFVVWSNSFVAASFLLGREAGRARLDFVSLSIARFAVVAPLALGWAFGVRARTSLALLRRFPVRLPVAALLSAPAYNLALYAGQQRGVPVPVASLTTALTPLFVMVLAALFLGEPLSARKGAAFLVALSGLVVIALSRSGEGGIASYPALLALTAIAPLSWSIYSILMQPVSRVASPVDWTLLTIGLGSLPLLALLPFRGRAMFALDAPGWGALLYLSLFCTLAGYTVWSWLLRHLPASSVGFFTFLNPPLATLSKFALASLYPAVFVWKLSPRELGGGALALAGLALALWPRRAKDGGGPAAPSSADPGEPAT